MRMNIRFIDDKGNISYEFWDRGFKLSNVSYRTALMKNAVEAAKRTAKRFKLDIGEVTYQEAETYKEYRLKIKGLNSA